VVIFLIYVGETIDFGICRDTGIPGWGPPQRSLMSLGKFRANTFK
jgi:hypothetical protein